MNLRTPDAVAIVLAVFLLGTSGTAQPSSTVTAGDQSAIQALMTQYAQALSGCKAAEFADLFVPETGYFASGFRGHMVGRDRLIALVQSERNCVAPAGTPQAARPGGAAGPTVVLDVSPDGVRGIASVRGAEYQDEYVKTPKGWKFASRTVITAAEKAAGLDARALQAIQHLAGPNLADHYEPDPNGVQRLMTSGVKVTVSDNQVTGRAYLQDGAYKDQVYEKLPSGEWRLRLLSTQ